MKTPSIWEQEYNHFKKDKDAILKLYIRIALGIEECAGELSEVNISLRRMCKK